MRSKLCSRLGAALVAVVMFPVVLAWLLARVLLADIFDDIGNALWGGIASVLDAVKDFVIGLVRHFVNGVTWLVNNLVGIVWSALTSLWASTVQWVHDLWTGVYWVLNTAWSAIQATYNTLVSLVDQAWHAMVGIVGNLWSVVSTLASWTEKAIGDTVAWVVHNVFDPLSTALSWVENFVTHTLPDFVNSAVNNLWCFVRDVAGSISSIASDVFDSLIGPFKGALNLLLKALDWLVFFALHPFTWFAHLFDTFFTQGSKWLIGKVLAGLQSNFTEVDHWLAKWLE